MSHLTVKQKHMIDTCIAKGNKISWHDHYTHISGEWVPVDTSYFTITVDEFNELCYQLRKVRDSEELGLDAKRYLNDKDTHVVDSKYTGEYYHIIQHIIENNNYGNLQDCLNTVDKIKGSLTEYFKVVYPNKIQQEKVN